MGSIRVSKKNQQIYVRFRYGEKQREEPTQYYCKNKGGLKECKCVSCNSARAIAYAVTRAINNNSFNYADFFPRSRALKSLGVAAVNDNQISIPQQTNPIPTSQGIQQTSSKITFYEYAVRWINAATVQPSTERSYRNHIQKLSVVFGEIDIREIVPIMIKEYKKTIQHYSPKYQKNILTTFSIVMESARQDRYIDENPLKYVPKPKVTLMKADPFFLQDIKKIIQYMDKMFPQYSAFFVIGFFMGLRVGEIMGLKWGDIDFASDTIRVQRTITDGKIKQGTKTTDYRDIKIPGLVKQYIIKQKKYTMLKSEWLFVTRFNTPIMSYSTITKYYWKKALTACGLRYREPYQMRHSFACNALLEGFDVNYIQYMLGHSSLEMVFKVYGNFIPNNTQTNGFNDIYYLDKIG